MLGEYYEWQALHFFPNLAEFSMQADGTAPFKLVPPPDPRCLLAFTKLGIIGTLYFRDTPIQTEHKRRAN